MPSWTGLVNMCARSRYQGQGHSITSHRITLYTKQIVCSRWYLHWSPAKKHCWKHWHVIALTKSYIRLGILVSAKWYYFRSIILATSCHIEASSPAFPIVCYLGCLMCNCKVQGMKEWYFSPEITLFPTINSPLSRYWSQNHTANSAEHIHCSNYDINNVTSFIWKHWFPYMPLDITAIFFVCSRVLAMQMHAQHWFGLHT